METESPTKLDLMLRCIVFIILAVFYSIRNIILLFVPESYKTTQKSIANEIVLVTGAGFGLGKLIAKKLAKHGAILVLWDINDNANKQTMNEIIAEGGKAHAFICDVSKKEQVYNVADRVRRDVGHVSILVNNAGILIGKKILELNDTDIERTVNINATAHFWTVRAFLKNMIEQNKGHIVSIASAAGYFGVNKLTDYCASKHFVIGYAEALKNELEHNNLNGIKFTTVSPGWIDTGLCDGVKSYKPILDPDYVTDRVVKSILQEEEHIFIPDHIIVIYLLKIILPKEAYNYLHNKILLANDSMDTFKGHSRLKAE